jgi:EAL domain-containing protein (putative c-di-GMP-specific phosphodiesterase class I)/DNA-binding response OmpR family regulator
MNHPPFQDTTTLLFVSAYGSTVAKQLARSLTDTGCSMVQAEEARTALEAFRNSSPDLVLIDMQLPEGTAVDLCRALRARPEAQHTPILMLHSAEADAADFAEACLAGATEFLEAGCPQAIVGHRLRTALELAHEEHGLLTTTGQATGGPLQLDTGNLQELVFSAIDRTRGTDLHVAVLVIMIEDPDSELTENIEERLQSALSAFQDRERMSFSRGRVHLSRDDSGNYVIVVGELSRIHEAAKLGRALQEDASAQRSGTDLSGSGLCIGVATSPEDGKDANSLLCAAHEAARRAREDGPGSLHFRNTSTNQWVFERLTLERSLEQAVENQELRVYYQPKVDIDTRRVVGMEALVRWQHPELGMVSPAQFIPLAEESGQIVPIGAWVLEEACRQCKAWQDAGFEPIRMAVNLSPVQFRQPDLLHVITSTLQRTGLDAKYLELEVTESMLMQDLQQTIATLRQLKAAGIYLSIDDFGTGYSSLSYLKGFPIDALKIDRSFVREITQNSDDAAIATSIILLGQNLNLKVIAEGVETESQLSFLRILQCDQIQGYLFSPPVPAGEVESFLERA